MDGNITIAPIAPASLTFHKPDSFSLTIMANGTCDLLAKGPDLTLYEVAEFVWDRLTRIEYYRDDTDVSLMGLVSFHHDGSLTFHSGYEPDEFARSVWNTIAKQRPRTSAAAAQQ